MPPLTLESNGPVATVTLRRPEVHNALGPELIAALTRAFQDLGRAPETRVVVLAAEGKSFSAGADLNWMRAAAHASHAENVADAVTLARMLEAVHHCPKPVLARVQGAAFGGGVGLVAACDLVAAMDTAVFCFSEAKLGLVPAVIAPFVLRRVPLAAARRYFLTAERFGAGEAAGIGLVSAVAESAEGLDETVAGWAARIAENGPEAVAACKRLVDEVAELPLKEALARMPERIAERRASAEGQEGMAAFLEKRPPSWRAPAPGESGT